MNLASTGSAGRPPPGVRLGHDVVLRGELNLGRGIKIGDFCVIGYAEGLKPGWKVVRENGPDVTCLGSGTVIHPFTVVHKGAKIGTGVEIDDHSLIGPHTVIGSGTRIVYGAKLYHGVEIGKGCIVSGFCCDGSRIGNRAIMMGHLVHSMKKPVSVKEWDRGPLLTDAPVVGEHAFVGYNSIIVGGVTIGAGAYIAAGAVVNRDVPPRTRMIPKIEWRRDEGGSN